MSSIKKLTTPLLMTATILAGMLSPMQSAVNGKLGEFLQDGNASAVISFGSGLILMFIVILSRSNTRKQFLSIPILIKIEQYHYGIGLLGCAEPWWYFLKAHQPAP